MADTLTSPSFVTIEACRKEAGSAWQRLALDKEHALVGSAGSEQASNGNSEWVGTKWTQDVTVTVLQHYFGSREFLNHALHCRQAGVAMELNANGPDAPRYLASEVPGGEGSPEPIYGLSTAGSVNQSDDAAVSLKLQEPQDVRGRLAKLTIPPTSLPFPEASSSCAQSAESNPRLSSIMMPDPDHGPLRPRNVVVFGESGVGKSSVINMIAGENVTETSNGALGCTSYNQCHQVVLNGSKLNLWDTVGLDEGTEGTVPALRAEDSLKAFLRQVARRNGIDLLLYCVRGTRVRQALLRNYGLFYAAICRKQLPVALVVTGLENYEEDMETWWIDHEKDLAKHSMQFDAHACVTTMQSHHPDIQGRLKQSRDVLCSLVQTNFRAGPWTTKEPSLVSASIPDVHALVGSFPVTAKRTMPLIVICDTTEPDGRVYPTPTIASPRESCAEYIDDRKYQCIHVDSQELRSGAKPCPETKRRPDLLIFYASADSRAESTWNLLKHFHASYGGGTSPLIVVFKGFDNPEAATEKWRDMSRSHQEELTANPTFYPDPDGPRELVERADETLAALIEEKCFIRSEEKMTRFRKLCRHSKSFFARRF